VDGANVSLTVVDLAENSFTCIEVDERQAHDWGDTTRFADGANDLLVLGTQCRYTSTRSRSAWPASAATASSWTRGCRCIVGCGVKRIRSGPKEIRSTESLCVGRLIGCHSAATAHTCTGEDETGCSPPRRAPSFRCGCIAVRRGTSLGRHLDEALWRCELCVVAAMLKCRDGQRHRWSHLPSQSMLATSPLGFPETP
jgi:hypothetical protein